MVRKREAEVVLASRFHFKLVLTHARARRRKIYLKISSYFRADLYFFIWLLFSNFLYKNILRLSDFA
jgi:hypothetical protein